MTYSNTDCRLPKTVAFTKGELKRIIQRAKAKIRAREKSGKEK